MAKYISLLLFVAGIVVSVLLALHSGIGSILESLKNVGTGGFFALIALQILITCALGFAWQRAFPQLPLWLLIKARFIRDAGATCLPFSQLGGMAIGVKATHDPKIGINWVEAIVYNVIDITAEVVGQVGFILLALACLLIEPHANNYSTPIAFGVAALIIGIIGFIWTQKKGGKFALKGISFLARRFAGEWGEAFHLQSAKLSEQLETVWANPLNVINSCGMHFLCWIASAIMVWASLYFLQWHQVSFLNCLCLEGLVCATMSAGFFIPAGLGIQEGAYVGIGAIFGVPFEIALSLSLLRRGRELALGVPTLLLWQSDYLIGLVKKIRKT